MDTTTITWDQFERDYQPFRNSFDPNASYDGFMHETFGRELEHVAACVSLDPDRVWTLIDGDDGPVIVDGYHHVNRLGYFLTRQPANGSTVVTDD